MYLSLADTVLTISLCRANLDLNSGKSVSLAVAVVALVLFTQTNHILVTLHSLVAFISLSQLLWAQPRIYFHSSRNVPEDNERTNGSCNCTLADFPVPLYSFRDTALLRHGLNSANDKSILDRWMAWGTLSQPTHSVS